MQCFSGVTRSNQVTVVLKLELLNIEKLPDVTNMNVDASLRVFCALVPCICSIVVLLVVKRAQDVPARMFTYLQLTFSIKYHEKKTTNCMN